MNECSMQIGILGDNSLGFALTKIWASKGHQIKIIEAREGKQWKSLAESGGSFRVGRAREVVSFGEAILLNIPWQGAINLLEAAGNLQGKILIDCTNPIKTNYSGLEIGHTTSAAEKIAGNFPEAQVVKAYSTLPPGYLERKPKHMPHFLFHCGNEPLAKKIVARLIADSGFIPLDIGSLEMARYVEPMSMIYAGLVQSGFNKEGMITFLECQNIR